MNDKQLKKYFDIFCITEFISCFLLFCIAMPLKYGYGIVSPMPAIGLFHGLAFIGYLFFALKVRKLYQWDGEEFMFVVMFAFIPFATWLVHNKVKKFDQENASKETDIN